MPSSMLPPRPRPLRISSSTLQSPCSTFGLSSTPPTLVWARCQTGSRGNHPRSHLPNPIADRAETPGGGQLKTWSRTIQEDLALLGGPRIYGLRRWNREWPVICTEVAQDRRAWSAIVRDAVNALEAASADRPSTAADVGTGIGRQSGRVTELGPWQFGTRLFFFTFSA